MCLGLFVLGCGPKSHELDAEALSAALDVAKSEAPHTERLTACDKVLSLSGESVDAPEAARIPMLVALGIKGWLLQQGGDQSGAAACKAQHRKLAHAIVAQHPAASDCRSHAAQLLAQDGDYEAAWALLLAVDAPAQSVAQEALLRGASLVHALHYDRAETALELKSLPSYAQLVQRMREAREVKEPNCSRVLELFAQECALRVRAGQRDAALALLAKAEARAPASIAVVRMRDSLGLPQQSGG